MHYQLEFDAEAWDLEPEAVETLMDTRVSDDLESFKAIAEAAA